MKAVQLEARAGAFQLGPLDLELPAHSLGALVGPSGAGKTTLLCALAGLIPTQGSVTLGGLPCGGVPPERRPIGWVPQGGGLFPHLTARGNVELCRARGAPPALALLDRVGALPLAGRWPAELSGGETLRVSLARALARRPLVLLLDEPLAALDRAAQLPLLALLAELAREGASILQVTHDAERALASASWLGVLEAGRLAASGPPLELVARGCPDALRRTLAADNVLAGSFEPLGEGLSGFRVAALPSPLRLAGELRGPGCVTFSAEAVGISLECPGLSASSRGAPAKSSVRNRLTTTVSTVVASGSTARLTLACGIEAEITLAAVRDLGLAPGARVIAEIKATAIRPLPRLG